MLMFALRRVSPGRSWSTRHLGVWFLLGLVCVISLERRAADLDVVPVHESILQNDDRFDSVEILDRLLGLVDIRPPAPPAPGRAPVATVVTSTFQYLPDGGLLTPTPRAPPETLFPR